MQGTTKLIPHAFMVISLILSQTGFTQVSKHDPDQELAHSIYKELIEINTTHSTGDCTLAADAMAKRLREGGFEEKDIVIIGPFARNQNMVARLHGSGKQPPILFLAHLDVVEAKPEDWSYNPFKLTETNGYFYGRGSLDVKSGAAILVANFIRLKKAGFIPDRDLILALTAGEESADDYDGVEWLVQKHRPLIDASFCVNMDAGEPQRKGGKRILRPVQVSEKGNFYLTLEVKNPGGHSSQPTKNNAIYRLADGLVRMQAFDFPVQLNDVTKSYFTTMSSLETGQLEADMKAVAQDNPDTSVINRLARLPYYNALMRSTCITTVVDAGNSVNALPQSAKATVNCRLLPGVTQEEAEKTVVQVLNDTGIHVSVRMVLKSGPASPSSSEIIGKVKTVTEKMWPGIPVLPVMGVGASDGKYLRAAGMPTYGISGVFLDVDDFRMHARDERIRVDDFYDGLEYIYEIIKTFSR
ncbi:MAG TPA: M20/M25/M40 family metallo-hydrolase [Puia sp.]|jgi:acetylornithine deacetylase/succinyl-diaminopimelate desuccinylase-like protein|nr:M20/M25/M40 family metallo-hydrolase [Puia sp.]